MHIFLGQSLFRSPGGSKKGLIFHQVKYFGGGGGGGIETRDVYSLSAFFLCVTNTTPHLHV